jgi:hypothetical protein
MPIKVTKPNGTTFMVPTKHLAEVVLELHGGGYTELQTRKAMLSADKLRAGEEVQINGYKLKLENENG